MGLILADTNIVIYILKGLLSVKPYLSEEIAISDITVIELLGVKDISKETLRQRLEFTENAFNFPVSLVVRNEAISIKQKYNIKLADALIASTAICKNIPLLTADLDFKKIKELPLILINPA